MTITYTVKLHNRRRMGALPAHQQGWWNSQPNATIQMRAATAEDLAGVWLRDTASHDPADYLRELNGSWILLRVAAQSVRPNGDASLATAA